jgi:hypothetical protein
MRFLLLASWWPVAALVLATACGRASDAPAGPDAATLMTSDFEQSPGWGGTEQPSLTAAQAHSGRTAVLASPQVPFGYTFARTLEELSPGKIPTKMELTAWVLRTAAGSTAQLVVQVDASKTDETRVAYASLPVAEAVPKFGEWTAVKLPITLPATAVGTNRLKVYLWNNQATTPTYLDDVVLRRQGE